MDSTASAGVGLKMEPKRMVGLAFLGFALAGGMLLSRIAERVFAAARLGDRQIFGIEDLTYSSVLGFALALGAATVLYFNPKVHAGSLDIAAELKSVRWPSMAETRVSTVAVIVASLISSVILFVFDLISSKAMTEWVPLGLGWLARL